MNVVAAGLVTEVEKTVRRAAIVADQVVVTSTPVDTGRARASWIATIGTPSDGIGSYEGKKGDRAANEGPAAEESLSQAIPVITSWKVGDASIFLANNVPYIGRLDSGSSLQASAGMTAQALQAAGEVIRKAKVVR